MIANLNKNCQPCWKYLKRQKHEVTWSKTLERTHYTQQHTTRNERGERRGGTRNITGRKKRKKTRKRGALEATHDSRNVMRVE